MITITIKDFYSNESLEPLPRVYIFRRRYRHPPVCGVSSRFLDGWEFLAIPA